MFFCLWNIFTYLKKPTDRNIHTFECSVKTELLVMFFLLKPSFLFLSLYSFWVSGSTQFLPFYSKKKKTIISALWWVGELSGCTPDTLTALWLFFHIFHIGSVCYNIIQYNVQKYDNQIIDIGQCKLSHRN